MNEASSRTTGCVLLRQAGINPPVLYSLPLCRLLRNCTPHSPCTESCLHVHVCFQRVTYETKKPTHDVRTIADVEGGVVKAGKMVEWKEQIIVPPLPQSSLTGCELIKIEYYVKVRYAHPLLRHPVLYCIVVMVIVIECWTNTQLLRAVYVYCPFLSISHFLSSSNCDGNVTVAITLMD